MVFWFWFDLVVVLRLLSESRIISGHFRKAWQPNGALVTFTFSGGTRGIEPVLRGRQGGRQGGGGACADSGYSRVKVNPIWPCFRFCEEPITVPTDSLPFVGSSITTSKVSNTPTQRRILTSQTPLTSCERIHCHRGTSTRQVVNHVTFLDGTDDDVTTWIGTRNDSE